MHAVVGERTEKDNSNLANNIWSKNVNTLFSLFLRASADRASATTHTVILGQKDNPHSDLRTFLGFYDVLKSRIFFSSLIMEI